ncbi:hypothetical protein FHG87_016873, partial [Trinorchestia longiramus]
KAKMGSVVIEQKMNTMTFDSKSDAPTSEEATASALGSPENKGVGSSSTSKPGSPATDATDHNTQEGETKEAQKKEEEKEEEAILTNILEGEKFECCLGEACLLGDKAATKG